jgi:hypothetical protein
MSEQRQHPRHRTLKAGRIVFNRKFSVMDCTVRNLSDGGACLVLGTVVGIPDQFELTVEPDGWTRLCRVAWKSENRMGVAFQ